MRLGPEECMLRDARTHASELQGTLCVAVPAGTSAGTGGREGVYRVRARFSQPISRKADICSRPRGMVVLRALLRNSSRGPALLAAASGGRTASGRAFLPPPSLWRSLATTAGGPVRIALEGNIASGKSTLLEIIRTEFSVFAGGQSTQRP